MQEHEPHEATCVGVDADLRTADEVRVLKQAQVLKKLGKTTLRLVFAALDHGPREAKSSIFALPRSLPCSSAQKSCTSGRPSAKVMPVIGQHEGFVDGWTGRTKSSDRFDQHS